MKVGNLYTHRVEFPAVNCISACILVLGYSNLSLSRSEPSIDCISNRIQICGSALVLSRQK